MTAQEHENRQGTPSMRQLLESCAAADAVSTPPADGTDTAGARTGKPGGRAGAVDADAMSAAAVLSVPDQRPNRDQDAA